MIIAILLAAGTSTRMGFNKLEVQIPAFSSSKKRSKKTVFQTSQELLQKHPLIDHVITVGPQEGGSTRMQSFLNGVQMLVKQFGGPNPSTQVLTLPQNTLILDHNAASPFVTEEEITALIKAAQKHGAAALSQPAVDTLVEVSASSVSVSAPSDGVSESPESTRNPENHTTLFYKKALDRKLIRHMQTPQAVTWEKLSPLISQSLVTFTDLSSALLANNIPVAVVEASSQNKKLTYPSDFKNQDSALSGNSESHSISEPPTTTYFLGQDSHRFQKESFKNLILGGLSILDLPAMQANSDGDVILHAIGRALAQATGLSFSGIADNLNKKGENDSAKFLTRIFQKLQEQGKKLTHVSVQIEGDRPKIKPIINDLKDSISSAINLSLSTADHLTPQQVTISAMTGEDLTSFGKGEGLRALAILTIQSSSNSA